MTPDEASRPSPRAPAGAPEAAGNGTPLLMPPTRLIRIAGVGHRVLEGIRAAPLDDLGRARAASLLRSCVAELQRCLEPTTREELLRLLVDMDGAGASDATLRMAQATVVGWLDGLLDGFQAAWSAQLMTNFRPDDAEPPFSAAGQRKLGAPQDVLAGRYL